MKMKKTIKLSAIAAAAVIVGGGLWYTTNDVVAPTDCASVYVDFGALDNDAKISKCVVVDGKAGALDVLKDAGVEVVGTGKYGNQVACRVNNLPAADRAILDVKGHEDYIESCAEMPAEFAYWGVFVKRGGDVVTKWDWASTGIADVVLESGDSIGLVFQTNEEVKIPE